MPAPHQTTVSSVIEELRSKKQDNEFLVTHQGLSAGTGKFYHPDELKITKTYRFEERSNPSYSSILYLIETNDGLKGYSLDAYGAYKNFADEKFETFITKVCVQSQEGTGEL
jgi:hypothetical protein